MDPDANLAEQRRLAKELSEAASDEWTRGRAGRLAELVQALDEWICKGGFLPKDWRENLSK